MQIPLGRHLDSPERDLAVEVVGEVLRAVIVANREPFGDVLADRTANAAVAIAKLAEAAVKQIRGLSIVGLLSMG
jgi:hypothetical protein